MLPLWWIIGIEQFFYTILIYVLLCLTVRRSIKKTYAYTLLLVLGSFLIAHCLSAFFITESMRYVTFTRHFSLYVTVFMLIYLLSVNISDFSDVMFISKSVLTAVFLSALVCDIIIIHGEVPDRFVSLFGSILPESISSTGYGGLIKNRMLASHDWFLLLGGTYIRVNGFFLYPTMFGPIIVISIILSMYLFSQTEMINKFAYGFCILVLGMALVFTTARISILSLIFGGLTWKLLFPLTPMDKKFSIIVLILGVMGIVALFMTIDVMDIGEKLLFSRGKGTVSSRTSVYMATLESLAERPVFGWGTERDLPGLSFPAGSHSYYMGILYRHGAVGILLFLGIGFCLWQSIKIPKSISKRQSDLLPMLKFLHYGKWIFIALALNSLTDALDLCGASFVLTWSVLSCLIVSKKIILNRLKASELISANHSV